jgi:hypothetical protein
VERPGNVAAKQFLLGTEQEGAQPQTLFHVRLEVARLVELACSQLDLKAPDRRRGDPGCDRRRARRDGFGRQHPDFMAQWVPLMRAALRKPASSPINAPPGKTSGLACRPPAAMPGAVGKTFAALKELADFRVCFVALELFEGRQIGVAVVEPDHEADRHHVAFQVIAETAAVSGGIHRPAGGVDHQAFHVLGSGDFPQFLDADAVGLRVGAFAQTEARFEFLAKVAAAAFGEKVYLARSSMPGWKLGPCVPS